MPRALDLGGVRFGKLVAVRPLPHRVRGSICWECLCDCGAVVGVEARSLNSGNTKSCGCLQRERVTQLSTRHGLSRSRTYRIWSAMVQRCTNPRHVSWRRYGGRGIAVDRRWLVFDNFVADMGEAPEGLELDRVDNHRGYVAGNCRWVSHAENMKNRSVRKASRTEKA